MEVLCIIIIKNNRYKKVSKISVIIPVYNAEKHLHRSIPSVLMQKEVGELVLVDDFSTDESLRICNEYRQKDHRIKVIMHKENKGSAAARNTGIKVSTLDYISFLDADDCFLEGRFISPLAYLISQKNLDGVYGKVKNIKLDNFRNPIYTHQEIIGCPYRIDARDLFKYIVAEKGDFFHIISLLLKKGFHEKSGFFDEDLIIGQDIDFTYSLAKNCKLEEAEENEIKIERYLHDGNITSSSKFLEFKPRYKLIQKWFDKLLKEDFDKYAARSIFKRYIHHEYIERGFKHRNFFRYAIKLFIGGEAIVKHRILFKKII
jgi:glycosyltransferase involved in cell wall biosynthesis